MSKGSPRALHLQNTIEDIYNLMAFSNTNTWKNLIYQTQLGLLGVTHLDLWAIYFGGSYDDAGVGHNLQPCWCSSEV